MSLAVLELNDAALTIRSENGELFSEPGFARLTDGGIETGEAARASAWLEPQSGFSQYWQQLNENPLLMKTPWARHHADIAYAQLKHLLGNGGEPDRCVLAVPGSFSNRQLGLLLGMFKALSIEPLAVVDSGVLARLDSASPGIYVDFQLHQGVVTILDIEAGELVVAGQDVIPELGVIRLQNQLARAIARQMIETTRFDPLHDPATEQWIFDNLPRWLRQLQWREELSLTMATPAGDKPFRLGRPAVADLLGNRLAGLEKSRRQYHGLPVSLSQAGGIFANLCPVLENVQVLAHNRVADNCLDHLIPALSPDEPLRRLTRLPVGERRAGPAAAPVPSLYLLAGNRAMSLAEPVSLFVGERSVTLKPGIDSAAAAVVVQRGGELEILQRGTDIDLTLPDRLQPGEHIEIGGEILTLIEVGRGQP